MSGRDCASVANKLGKEQQPVYDAVGYEPASVDLISHRVGFAVDRVSAVLIDLELAGQIECVDGSYQRVGAIKHI